MPPWSSEFATMPAADPTIPSLLMSALVLVTAGLLAARQWNDRQNREGDLAEAEHFARQDVRRFVGAALMAVIALAMLVGSRIDHRVAGGQHRLFAGIWIGIFILIFALLFLALHDWITTLSYARRQRKAIIQERKALFEAGRTPPHPTLPTNGQAASGNGPPLS